MITDPVEIIIFDALRDAGVNFTTNPNETSGLDFMVHWEPPIHIECKRFHSPRISEQTSRVKNVIVVQGIDTAHWIAAMLRATVTPEQQRP